MEKEKKLPKEALDKLMKNEVELDVIDDEKSLKVIVDKDEIEIEPEAIDAEVKDIEKDEVIEVVTYNKEINYAGRGFRCLDDAINFPKTKTFKALGDADKQEYLRWLEK